MSATYILFPNVDVAKRRLMFLFLPHKEKIIGSVVVVDRVWWSVLCLKESGWGPPRGVAIVAHKRVVLFLVVLFYFLFRKSGSKSSCFYFPIFVLLESPVRRVGYANINSQVRPCNTN